MTDTNYAVAPGEYLEAWIEDQGLSQQRVAELLGSSRKQVNEIVNGRAPITSDTAMRLERVVGIPARPWLRYEAMYRADLAQIISGTWRTCFRTSAWSSWWSIRPKGSRFSA